MRRGFGLVLISLLLIAGCAKEECDDAQYDAMCLETMGCPNSLYQLQLESINDFELIQSQEDFNTMINGTCMPEIDWVNFDLVVGTARLTNGVGGITKTYSMDCNTNQLKLNVTIQLNLTDIAPTIMWNSLIPKLKDNESLFVSVNILN
jgi:hypothetical protein